MTYEPITHWSCSICGSGGEITSKVQDSVDIRWNAVVDAHRVLNSECDRVYGQRGIGVKQEAGELPA